jgi:glyoxylate carboligase
MAYDKKQVFAAAILAIIAITAIAYAQLLTGTITVSIESTEKRLQVQSSMPIGTVPARAAGSKTFEKAINVTLQDGEKALIGFELVADDLNIYKGFRAFVVRIENQNDTTTLFDGVVVLTLNNPYAEIETFSITASTEGKYWLKVTVTYAAGEVTVDNVNVRLRVTIKAITSSS